MTPAPPAPDWNPRHDATCKSEWPNHLVTHRDEWFHPTDLWSTEDEWQRTVLRQVAREVVVAARRLGYVIDGDRRRGYCYRGVELPRNRFLHGRAPNRAAATYEQMALPLVEAAR